MSRCPVCGYDALPGPPRDQTICPSCGTQFDYDDFGLDQHEIDRRRIELRNRWISGGARWQSQVIEEPAGWDPLLQLVRAGFPFQLDGGLRAITPGVAPASESTFEFYFAGGARVLAGLTVLTQPPPRVQTTERSETIVYA